SHITLVLGNGRGANEVEIPNLVGLTLTEAKFAILGLGLNVGSISGTVTDSLNARVIEQSPDVTSKVIGIGSSINLTLSNEQGNSSMANNRKIIQWLGIIGLILLLAGGFLAFKLYQAFMAPAILENEEGYFYVYSGDTYEDVLERIKSENILKHPDQFDFVAQRMDYPNSVKAGRYKL